MCSYPDNPREHCGSFELKYEDTNEVIIEGGEFEVRVMTTFVRHEDGEHEEVEIDEEHIEETFDDYPVVFSSNDMYKTKSVVSSCARKAPLVKQRLDLMIERDEFDPDKAATNQQEVALHMPFADGVTMKH